MGTPSVFLKESDKLNILGKKLFPGTTKLVSSVNLLDHQLNDERLIRRRLTSSLEAEILVLTSQLNDLEAELLALRNNLLTETGDALLTESGYYIIL